MSAVHFCGFGMSRIPYPHLSLQAYPSALHFCWGSWWALSGVLRGRCRVQARPIRIMHNEMNPKDRQETSDPSLGVFYTLRGEKQPCSSLITVAHSGWCKALTSCSVEKNFMKEEKNEPNR